MATKTREQREAELKEQRNQLYGLVGDYQNAANKKVKYTPSQYDSNTEASFLQQIASVMSAGKPNNKHSEDYAKRLEKMSKIAAGTNALKLFVDAIGGVRGGHVRKNTQDPLQYLDAYNKVYQNINDNNLKYASAYANAVTPIMQSYISRKSVIDQLRQRDADAIYKAESDGLDRDFAASKMGVDFASSMYSIDASSNMNDSKMEHDAIEGDKNRAVSMANVQEMARSREQIAKQNNDLREFQIAAAKGYLPEYEIPLSDGNTATISYKQIEPKFQEAKRNPLWYSKALEDYFVQIGEAARNTLAAETGDGQAQMDMSSWTPGKQIPVSVVSKLVNDPTFKAEIVQKFLNESYSMDKDGKLVFKGVPNVSPTRQVPKASNL